MIRVLHLIDEAMHDDAWRMLRQLTARLGGPHYAHVVGLIGPVANELAGVRDVRFGRRWGWLPASAVGVRAAAAKGEVNVLHAWTGSAAAVAQLASEGRRPVILTVVETPHRSRWSRWVAATAGCPVAPSAVACVSKMFFRRAVEAGLPPGSCGVIRPAIDFGLISAARRTMSRALLGIPGGAPVLLTDGPASRAGGQYYAIWAAALLQQIWPDVRVVVPGVTRENHRLQRFVASFRLPQMLVSPGRREPIERLLAVADVFVTAARGDTATGCLPWAMASGVPIVGSAVPCVAEFIADHQNGLLCPPDDPVALAGRIRAALRDRDLARRIGETARAQAYESFSLGRMTRQYQKLYDNVLVGAPPFDGIDEEAMAS
jgi:glycosyltransferase involved in cell wall biosynthesis